MEVDGDDESPTQRAVNRLAIDFAALSKSYREVQTIWFITTI